MKIDLLLRRLVAVKKIIPAVLLLGILCLCVGNHASAQIVITIAPVAGQPTQALITATGTVLVMPNEDTGHVTFDSPFYVPGWASTAYLQGSFGGIDLAVLGPVGVDVFRVTTFSEIGDTTSPAEFVMASQLVDLPDSTYALTFIPGVYTGMSGTGMFATTASSFTLTVSAIPEPSSYAVILGMLCLSGTVASRRPRSRVRV